LILHNLFERWDSRAEAADLAIGDDEVEGRRGWIEDELERPAQ